MNIAVFCLIVFTILLIALIYGTPLNNLELSVDNLFEGLGMFFYFFILFATQWGYFIFFETLMRGSTPGKSIMRIRVVTIDGTPLDFTSIILRNLIRDIDGVATVMIAGIISVIFSKHYRRLGDLAASTIVIKDVRKITNIPDFTLKADVLVDNSNTRIIKRLTEKDLFVLREFIKSYDSLAAGKKETLANNLAAAVRKKLNDPETETESYQYLVQVYKGHENE